MRLWSLFAAPQLFPSDTLRHSQTPSWMVGLRHKERHKLRYHTEPLICRRWRGCDATPSRVQTRTDVHFPSPPPSLSAKVCSYLVPLPYMPQGKRSLSAY
jgi:hypothetical protein